MVRKNDVESASRVARRWIGSKGFILDNSPLLSVGRGGVGGVVLILRVCFICFMRRRGEVTRESVALYTLPTCEPPLMIHK